MSQPESSAAISLPPTTQVAEPAPSAQSTVPAAVDASSAAPELDPSQSQPPLSQPLLPAELPSSADQPLTQEPPPPTQTTDADSAPPSSQNVDPAVPASLSNTQETSGHDVDTSLSTAATTVPSEPAGGPNVTSEAAQGEDASTQPMDVDPVPQTHASSSTTEPHAASATNAQAPVQPSSAPIVPKTEPGTYTSVPVATPSINGTVLPSTNGAHSNAAAPIAADDGPRPPPGAVQLTSAQIKFAQNTIRSLKVRQEARWFLDPVDPIALNIPHYHNIVREPMDLGTVDLKLANTSYTRSVQVSNGAAPKPTEKVKQAISKGLDPAIHYYDTIAAFEYDVKLVFNNCAKFNGEEHAIAKQGRELEKVFDKQLSQMPTAEAPEKKVVPSPIPPKPRTSSISAGPTPARRTSSTDASGRPKREIIPPAILQNHEDVPLVNSAGPSSAKKRRRTALTPREQQYYARINSEDLKFAGKVMEEMYKKNLESVAWVFYQLPDTSYDFAPAYYEQIKQPISMQQIEMKLKAGEFSDLTEFDAAWQLLFRNCFTFNPPGSDVAVMGKSLKDAYEEKMRKRPVHQPLSPDPLEDVDMVDADDEESRLAEIEAKIAKLKAEAASLKSKDAKPVKSKSSPVAAAGPSAKKPKKATATAAAAAAPYVPAVNGVTKAAADPSVPKAPKKKAPKPKDINGVAPAAAKKKSGGPGSPTRKNSGGASGSNGAPKKQRRESQPAKVVDTFQEITYQQKEELAIKIQELPEERLDGALSIIAEDKPPSAGDQDEIELDIDAIEPRTLYKLYTYVVGPVPGASVGGIGGANGGGRGSMGGAGGAAGAIPEKKKKKNAKKSKPASGAGAADGRKRGTGGLKRKNLDEEEEAQRIASLRQQLNQFNSGDTSVAASTAGLPADGGHDDLVHSDSSSGDESGSDSDSDFD
ncbi:transcription initiation at TATA-containing promoter protein [Tilletia horrida]|uniref:Transcription initiation at TATA-containing promoter protein n=1 Tax=Tilletia horrida TaxID=155126 RepID=A0AAN6GV58_9BASI|nr:transcription initiation at TATA-containing promoter protein [Tilletia horrida]KAK0555952.1 transcription initiation at TATA-containing promoter protein [Tilletia horrida]KAK0568840.1 transcription initiation at TATA-containing promoter protein [Tilletia horrida]